MASAAAAAQAAAEAAIHTTAEAASQADDRGPLMIAVAVAFLAITWTVVSLRVWVRGFMIKSFGWDDAIMIVTLIWFSAYCAVIIVIADIGNGGHDIQPESLPKLMILLLTSFALYCLVMACLKVALGIFFLRVVVKNWQRYVIYVTIFISTGYNIAYLFLAVFQCGNPSQFLLHEFQQKCSSTGTLLSINYTSGVINALSDWVFALLPISIVWSAKMPRPAKISAGCILGLGALGSIASIIRLIYIGGLLPNFNFFSTAVNVTIWSIVEPGIGITAASLATLRPLLRSCFESMKTSLTPSDGTRRSNKKSTNGSDNTWLSDDLKPASPVSFSERKGYGPGPNWEDRNITTVIGNSRVMEKMGHTNKGPAAYPLQTINEVHIPPMQPPVSKFSRPLPKQSVPRRSPSQQGLINNASAQGANQQICGRCGSPTGPDRPSDNRRIGVLPD